MFNTGPPLPADYTYYSVFDILAQGILLLTIYFIATVPCHEDNKSNINISAVSMLNE